jgi:hypothetical protein
MVVRGGLVPDQRSTADARLARIKEQDRPRLRIYIGAVPGVGKTYEMLQEAHALRTRGLDVVVRFVVDFAMAPIACGADSSRQSGVPNRIPQTLSARPRVAARGETLTSGIDTIDP